MGAFWLSRARNHLHVENCFKIFEEQGLCRYIVRDFGSFRLWLYQKVLSNANNYIEEDGFFLGTIGTPVYKGLTYRAGLNQLLLDYISGNFSFDDLIGHYYIFIWDKQQLTLLSDGGRQIKAFHDSSATVLSSSFLALMEVLPHLSVNRDVAIENLVTGGAGGNETLFHEINELSKSTLHLFPDIYFKSVPFSNRVTFRTKQEAVDCQIDVLNRYFKAITPIANEVGVDCGLTGGLDSRLILAVGLNHFEKVQVHSHYRSVVSKELEIARNMAMELNLSFVSPPVKEWNQRSDDEKQSILAQSCLFYDGQIRMHCYWNEEYNTLAYRLSILNRNGLGLHGIGGEQYRNVERRYFSYDYKKWIRHILVGKVSGNPFTSANEEEAFIDRLGGQISMRVDGIKHKGRLSLYDLKRIQNEYLIPSYRGARTHAEAKVSFFLSPFSDTTVSTSSYSAVPFLGCGLDFEREMIDRISPRLASFQSDYGFSFNKREPIYKQFSPFILENFVPTGLAHAILRRYKKLKTRKRGNYSVGITNHLQKGYIQNVEKLELPLDINGLLAIPDVAPLVISMGYLLEKYNYKIQQNA